MNQQDFLNELHWYHKCFRISTNFEAFAEFDPTIKPLLDRLTGSQARFFGELNSRLPKEATYKLGNQLVPDKACFDMWAKVSIEFHQEGTRNFLEFVAAARQHDSALVPSMEEYWDSWSSIVHYLKSRVEC